MNQLTFNERIRQIILLAIIIIVGIAIISHLSEFVPGILGAVTLYILSRKSYFRWVYQKKKKKGLMALLYILGFLVLIAIPFYFSITLISPKISELMANPDKILNNIKMFGAKLKDMTGITIISEKTTQNLGQTISSFVPKFLNSTLSIITNLATMFFLLYYLLVSGSTIERNLAKIIPLQKSSVDTLAKETRMMVRANAVGIPVISIIQGITATIGYWIFGVSDWGLWGFVTGVFAFFPIVGTMIIWVPIMIAEFAMGHNSAGIGLLIYNIVITGNVDYVARMSLMRRMGDIHPVVTVLGVIVGLNLFGFVGLIFGPLLISYLLILIKIYSNEFAASKEDVIAANANEPEPLPDEQNLMRLLLKRYGMKR